jgi:hypothetical protein
MDGPGSPQHQMTYNSYAVIEMVNLSVRVGGRRRRFAVAEQMVGDSQYRAKVAAQVLAMAKQLIAGRLGVIAAARKLSCFRHDFDPDLVTPLTVFIGVASEMDDLPVGDVRQYWAADALERKDRDIAEAERFYRDSAIEAATELVRLLEVPS